jgi:hypothetical protein
MHGAAIKSRVGFKSCHGCPTDQPGTRNPPAADNRFLFSGQAQPYLHDIFYEFYKPVGICYDTAHKSNDLR